MTPKRINNFVIQRKSGSYNNSTKTVFIVDDSHAKDISQGVEEYLGPDKAVTALVKVIYSLNRYNLLQ